MVTGVVRCDPVVRGPDVAPMWPHRSRAWKRVPAVRSAEILRDGAGQVGARPTVVGRE